MAVEDQATGMGRGWPLWAKLLLVVSLSVNLVVAGLFVGHAIRGEPKRPGGDWIERRILSALPESRHEWALGVVAERGDELAELREMREALRDQAAAIMEAEEYDAEAMLAVFDKRQLASSAYFALYYERVAEIASDLTVEERKALSEGLLRRRPRSRSGPGATASASGSSN